jgi:HAD superfamily hydrolase (TIGR01549 family)
VELGRDLTVLIFDFDGTLFHLDVDWESVRRTLDVGATETLGEAIQRLALAQDPSLAAVTATELAALGDRRLDPAVAGTLEALAGRYRIAVLTRNSREVVLRAFAGTTVADSLYVVGREDSALLKPDPAGLRMVLDHFEIGPAQAVLIGDTYHDVEAARTAGMYCVVVHNDRLAYRPTGADRYLNQIADLLPLLTERNCAQC